MTMTIATAIAEIDRLRAALASTEQLLGDACAANAKLTKAVETLRTERNTWRTESGR